MNENKMLCYTYAGNPDKSRILWNPDDEITVN